MLAAFSPVICPSLPWHRSRQHARPCGTYSTQAMSCQCLKQQSCWHQYVCSIIPRWVICLCHAINDVWVPIYWNVNKMQLKYWLVSNLSHHNQPHRRLVLRAAGCSCGHMPWHDPCQSTVPARCVCRDGAESAYDSCSTGWNTMLHKTMLHKTMLTNHMFIMHQECHMMVLSTFPYNVCGVKFKDLN